MKAINKRTNFQGKPYTAMLLLFSVLLLQSCARKVHFLPSSVVPAAEGLVKVKKDKNNNYHIDMKVYNLADSKRLNPPREIYVVWMETEQNETKNIGQIKSSNSAFSKTLKSSLETVSSSKPGRFFITAEDNANIQSPGGQEVLKTEYYKR